MDVWSYPSNRKCIICTTNNKIIGIPQLLERAFKNLGPTLFKTDFSFITGESFIDKDEVSLTNRSVILVEKLILFYNYWGEESGSE